MPRRFVLDPDFEDVEVILGANVYMKQQDEMIMLSWTGAIKLADMIQRHAPPTETIAQREKEG